MAALPPGKRPVLSKMMRLDRCPPPAGILDILTHRGIKLRPVDVRALALRLVHLTSKGGDADGKHLLAFIECLEAYRKRGLVAGPLDGVFAVLAYCAALQKSQFAGDMLKRAGPACADLHAAMARFVLAINAENMQRAEDILAENADEVPLYLILIQRARSVETAEGYWMRYRDVDRFDFHRNDTLATGYFKTLVKLGGIATLPIAQRVWEQVVVNCGVAVQAAYIRHLGVLTEVTAVLSAFPLPSLAKDDADVLIPSICVALLRAFVATPSQVLNTVENLPLNQFDPIVHDTLFPVETMRPPVPFTVDLIAFLQSALPVYRSVVIPDVKGLRYLQENPTGPSVLVLLPSTLLSFVLLREPELHVKVMTCIRLGAIQAHILHFREELVIKATATQLALPALYPPPRWLVASKEDRARGLQLAALGTKRVASDIAHRSLSHERQELLTASWKVTRIASNTTENRQLLAALFEVGFFVNEVASPLGVSVNLLCRDRYTPVLVKDEFVEVDRSFAIEQPEDGDFLAALSFKRAVPVEVAEPERESEAEFTRWEKPSPQLLEKQARIAAEADKRTASQRLAAADDDWERMPDSELAATESDDDVVVEVN
ncbi:hypothetical protein DIPPA_20265 [Diplonema papillatum]|nr:hypothetical protein DIPPA_20265 [Diplonema papillatum]